jgi:hypothetical protein
VERHPDNHADMVIVDRNRTRSSTGDVFFAQLATHNRLTWPTAYSSNNRAGDHPTGAVTPDVPSGGE